MNKNYLYPGFIDEVKGCLNKGSGSGGGGEPVDAYTKTQTDNLLFNKVDKEDGKSLIADTEIERLASVDNYDDTQVKTQIQAVANGLMDSVGYSADYKSIDIIAKNSEKKSIDVAPIISHASITELSDVDTTNKATGKALVYNTTTGKHEYKDVSSTDEKVKMDASTDAKYLGELLDNVTIANENGELKVKKLDGQEVSITEINYLKGLTMNVMDLVNMFSNGGVKIINTPVATYAELLTIDKSSFIEGISYLVYVLADENHDNAKTTYLVDKDSKTPTYFGFADSQRDFTTNPIDLAAEITGKLGIANMDLDAIKALFTVDDTYKTETVTNNAFSTHGAKALYDELHLAIGNKANNSDLTTHKNDTDIHVSTEDRTKWDSAKTHADSAHAPSNAQENVLETVKVNGTALTPSSKAVNIDLSDYAKTADIPTSLPADGGNSKTVNNHTVEADVPTDAVFTDTVYDDTEVKENIAELNNNLEAHTGNKQNPHGVTKSQIGLGNVENKSSATIRSELTSSNVTTALGYTPLDSAKKGTANGVAELGSDGKVPSSQLPSYVDDVLEYSSKSSFPSKGEAGKIYVDTSTNLTYRWSGSAYREISQSLALGETSSTAYRGDRGKIAYEHSQKTSGNPHKVTKSDVGLSKVDNTADNDKVVKSLIDSSGATVAGGKVGELTYYSTEGAVSTTKDIACLTESPSSGGYSLHRMPLSKLKSRLGVDKVDNTSDLDKPISTATQTALDEINSNLSNLKVGGRNYILNSGRKYTKESPSSNYEQQNYYYTTNFYDLRALETGYPRRYAVSVWYTKIDGKDKPFSKIILGSSSNNDWGFYVVYDSSSETKYPNGLYRFTKIIDINNNTNGYIFGDSTNRFLLIWESSENTGCNIKGVKLERDTPTDWTPAPEDVESEIKTLSDRISALENK